MTFSRTERPSKLTSWKGQEEKFEVAQRPVATLMDEMQEYQEIAGHFLQLTTTSLILLVKDMG